MEQLLRQLITQPSWSGIEAWRVITRKHDSLSKMPTSTLPYLHKRAGRYEDILARDGDCYFLDTFTVNRLEKTYRIRPDKKSAAAKHEQEVRQLAADGTKALEKLLQSTNELKITPPTPYYAMVQMDGDRMGILLSGVKEVAKHRAISAALSKFSREHARQIVEEQYPGRLIYAGGDDVFALAPLVRDRVEPEGVKSILSVFGLVDQLQKSYSETVGAAVAPDLVHTVSASIGIAIAHHYTSLSYVRRLAKAAEDLAKKQYGRSALVVSVMRRSGEQTIVGCHWRYSALDKNFLQPDPAPDKNFLQPLGLFTQFFTLFKDDLLSPKCIYILLEEAPALINMADSLEKAKQSEKQDEKTGQPEEKDEQKENIYKDDVRVSEIKRILQRQSDEQQIRLAGNINFLYLATNIVMLADAMDEDKDEKGRIRVAKEDRALELHSDRPGVA